MFSEQTALKQLSDLLPEEFVSQYTFQSLLHIKKHNILICLTSKVTDESFVLKILDKKYAHPKIIQIISELPNSKLLFSIQTLSDPNYFYFLYPKMKTLSDFLAEEEITYQMIHRLVNEIGSAINTLHQHNIIHLDVTPDNIFLDQKGNFYLGDFSSSCLAKNTTLFHQHIYRTGTSPEFAPPNNLLHSISFWHDQYSFSLLIYLLLNKTVPSAKNTNPIFSSVNVILEKAMKNPMDSSPSHFSQILSELHIKLSVCEKNTKCKTYHVTLSELPKQFSNQATPNCNTERVQNKKFHFLFQRQISSSVPVPLYGLLMICSFLLLFSVYHYTAQSSKKTAQITDRPITETVLSKNPDNETAPPFPDTQNSTFSSLATARVPNNPTVMPEQCQDNIIYISHSAYDDDTFLEVITSPKAVHILFADSCHFSSCKYFSSLTDLQELYLNNNPISSVQTLQKLPNLHTLILSKCKITDVSALAKTKNLSILDLSHNNKLKKIRSLASLKKLKFLILTNTNASEKEIQYLQQKMPQCTLFY